MSGTLTQTVPGERAIKHAPRPRVISVDALRGLTMFAMIFVNDLSGAPHVPWWMKHFVGPNGMTFVDMVYPAFLFIVGMSIPLALGGRLAKGQPVWKAFIHVLVRTVGLLAIGIMMVNSDLHISSANIGWSATLWTVLMFISSILAFCHIAPRTRQSQEEADPFWWRLTLVLRIVGIAMLIFLALTYRDAQNRQLLRLHPFNIRHAWYGILGVIGWSYFMAAVAFLIFRTHRTALLACTALVMSLYLAGKDGLFDGYWIARHVNIASALGSHAAISVAGVLLGSILIAPDKTSHGSRIRFTVWFIIGSVVAAILLYRPWLVSKELGTPAWCFWACAITAALWLIFYIISDAVGEFAILKPLATAGQNVLLPYLLSEMLPWLLTLLHINGFYDKLAAPNLACAIIRSTACAVVILILSVFFNRRGFWVRL
jgi:predicted acyltransferase